MSLSRRRLLGIVSCAAAGTAGAFAGAELGLAHRARPGSIPALNRRPVSRDRLPDPLWRKRVAADVVLTAADPSLYLSSLDQNWLSALRTADGAVRWEAHGVQTLPVIGAGLAYVTTGNNRLSALDVRNGKEQWGLPGAYFGALTPDMQTIYAGTSPSGAQIAALDARSGRPLWQVPAAIDNSGGSDIPFATAPGTVYTSTNSMLRALDAHTGTELWRWQSPAASFSAGPHISQDVIYGGHDNLDYSHSVLFALDARDGRQLWTSPFPAELFAMAATDAAIYAAATPTGSGGGPFGAKSQSIISARAARSGTAVWTTNLANLNQIFAVSGSTAVLSTYPSAQSGGIVYPGGADSQAELTSLNLTIGQVTWRVPSAGWSLIAPPVFTHGWTCAGFTHESIRVVHVTSGMTKWNMPMHVVSAPVVQSGLVFAVGADYAGPDGTVSPRGTLYAIPV